MQTFEIGANQAGQRLDKFLNKFMPTAGSSFLYKMLRKKNITLNGKKAEGKEILAVGDTVSFFFSDETYHKFTEGGSLGRQTPTSSFKAANPYEEYRRAFRELKGISVIYEDENVLIVNKPAGILTQKADNKQVSLNEWMIGYLLQKKKLSEETLKTFKPSVVNRLDRNTSGLVLCGISLPGSQMLSKLIHDRKIGKYYITIVEGTIREAASIEGYLTKDAASNTVKITAVKNGAEDGSPIQTAYRPLSYGKNLTCLEVELITGKTHQIRAHLSSIGHPIVGDSKYGRGGKQICGLKHQLLHAYRVEFPELKAPFENLSQKSFTAELPQAFKEVFRYGNMEIPRP